MSGGEATTGGGPDPQATSPSETRLTLFPLLREIAACPVCSSRRVRPLHVYPMDTRVARSPSLALTGCEACGIVFSHPLPSESELEEHYSSSDGWEERLSWRDDEAMEQRRLKKLPLYEHHFELLMPHLGAPGHSGEKAPKVIDHGCGTGGWLDVFADRGWETCGVEPGDIAREYASRRHRMLSALPAGEAFQLAILSHVLEHVRDPLGTVRDVARTLDPGGRLFVSVPDLSRLGAHRKLKYVVSRTHIFSYTRSGMESLLGLAGLRVAGWLDEPEWEHGVGTKGTRLRVLAIKEGESPIEASREPEPLREALESLRAYDARSQKKLKDRTERPEREDEDRPERGHEDPPDATGIRARVAGLLRRGG